MRCALVVCIYAALVGSPTASQKECAAAVPDHIRIEDCRLAAMVAEGLGRSPTLGREVNRVADLHGIVYVVTGVYASLRRKELLGALSPRVAVAGETCVMRIMLKRQSGPEAVATLAHELHHAIEVLEVPGARTEKSIETLFERIGSPVGYEVYETRAAVTTEAAVLRELRVATAAIHVR
ncbi:MAG TPA: hypothetical protein VFZ98_04050 [Vicinamibacterales bacterium]